MAFDVARVRGLHPTLGDGWVHLDAQAGMLIPDSVATTVSTAFRTAAASSVGPHPSARRSATLLDAARKAVAELVNGDPAGVVLGADRAVLLMLLADASSSRARAGYEIVVTRLDDEANILPWLRASDRYGAKARWAEVDVETGDLPAWQWENLVTKTTRLVAIASASSTLGTVVDLRPVIKLTHDVGGLVIVDHTAAAPYELFDFEDSLADVVVLNTSGWGGPPVGALVFREPAQVATFASMSTDPYAVGPGRLEMGVHQYGLLGGVVASVEYLAGLDEAATGTRRERLAESMRSGAAYLQRLLDYLMQSLSHLPLVIVLGQPDSRIPVVSFVVSNVPAERVVQRLADNGVLAIANWGSRVLDVIGVNEIGGAVTVGLAHYSTMYEVDQLVRALASLG
jgi:cysteine desulfurase family protein (TIGR01976 family)